MKPTSLECPTTQKDFSFLPSFTQRSSLGTRKEPRQPVQLLSQRGREANHDHQSQSSFERTIHFCF
jgi:hypothetical protein